MKLQEGDLVQTSYMSDIYRIIKVGTIIAQITKDFVSDTEPQIVNTEGLALYYHPPHTQLSSENKFKVGDRVLGTEWSKEKYSGKIISLIWYYKIKLDNGEKRIYNEKDLEHPIDLTIPPGSGQWF